MTRPVLVIEMAGLTRLSAARTPRLAALRDSGFETRWDVEPGPRPWWEASGRHGGRHTVWVVGPASRTGAGEPAEHVRQAVTAARQLFRTCRPGLALVRLPFPAHRPQEADRLLAPLLDDARGAAAAVVVIGAPDGPARGPGPFALCSERRAARTRVTAADVPGLLAELAGPDRAVRPGRPHHRCPWCTVRRTPADHPGRALR